MKLARGTLAPIHTYRITSWGNDRFNLEEYKKTNFGTQWVITTEQGVFITLRALSLLRTEVVSGSGCIVWAAIRYEDRAIDPDVRKVRFPAAGVIGSRLTTLGRSSCSNNCGGPMGWWTKVLFTSI